VVAGGGGKSFWWEQETAVFLGQAWGRGGKEGFGEKWGILGWVLVLAAEMEALGVGENLRAVKMAAMEEEIDAKP
jgi:hypothetical protein